MGRGQHQSQSLSLGAPGPTWTPQPAGVCPRTEHPGLSKAGSLGGGHSPRLSLTPSPSRLHMLPRPRLPPWMALGPQDEASPCPTLCGRQAARTCQLPVLPADPTVMLRPQHLHLGRSRVEPPPDRPRPVAPREKARSVSPPKDPERHTGRAQRTEWPSSSPHVSSVPQAQSKEVQVKTSDTGQEAELFPVPLKQSTLC